MPRTRSLLLAAVALVGAGVAGTSALPSVPAAVSTVSCPPGTVSTAKSPSQQAVERKRAGAAYSDLLARVDAETAGRLTSCRPLRSVEPYAEKAEMAAQRDAIVAGPPGALRAAVQASAANTAAGVPGANGTMTPVGSTPLKADVAGYDQVTGEGLHDLAGRVDSYAYDPVHGRLFAAPGTGGIWESADLGKSWRSVGDRLPYQSVGAVDWSPAGSSTGTIVVVSGEASAGGGVYTGLGAFWSSDDGASWHHAAGVPDGLMGFQIAVDPSDPAIVYAATSQGLFRSTDTGHTYTNVKLPTGACAGVTGYGNRCQNANWVTDVEVQSPGGTTHAKGGTVLAAVGYRAGHKTYFDGTDQSPRNGLYRSDTGAPGTFTYLDSIFATSDADPMGFAPQAQIGRTELGAARGPKQDHGYLYAIVEDAVLFNGGVPSIDAVDTTGVVGALPYPTAINGVYVSPDFGLSWTRMADDNELQAPGTESALSGTGQAQLYGPGVQSWYDLWISPDPTLANASGVPTRLAFGMEEVWESRLSGTAPQDATQAANPASFHVVGPYFAGDTCLFLNLGLPYCPTTNTSQGQSTTHPDQQSGIWIPKADGGVTLVVGNDGGSYRQEIAPGGQIDKTKWGTGSQAGYHTLLAYDAAPAKDGTIWFGLQDNGSGKIEPNGRQVMAFGGDGFYVAVDPDNSKVAYEEYTLGDMNVTTDGGKTWTNIPPGNSGGMFSQPFVMDPTDADHLLTGGPEIMERTTGPKGSWKQVFTTGTGTQVSATELQGDAAYVGYCSTCDIINKDPKTQVFSSGIATNVGGDAPPSAGSSDGWHKAAAKGLPERYVTGIAVDPANPRTVYVTLGGYSGRRWWPEGSYNDGNKAIGSGHVFKSTDAGATFADISRTLPDVPAMSIETNGGQLVVGTEIGAFLSSDSSGAKWAKLAGLPNVPVLSVRNQPGKASQVVLGTFGRGVYRYTMSARSITTSPAVVAAPPARGHGSLPATGLPAAVGAVGLLALAGGLALRRRQIRVP